MKTVHADHSLPPTFTISFSRDGEDFRLSAAQVLPLPRERAFAFFEDPRNLSGITPGWLDFRLEGGVTAMAEGATFDYTLRWFGLAFSWRSRIEGYRPPERFTDVQVVGPYRRWEHLHTFEEAIGGTLMRDEVSYAPPLGLAGEFLHALVIRHQLEDIFRYRAVRIDRWAAGESEENVPRGNPPKPSV